MKRLFILLLTTTGLMQPLLASGSGPNGVNIGFNFNWGNGPAGADGAFIDTVSGSGATLQICGAASVTPTSIGCNFAFSYAIGGVPQTGVSPDGNYGTASSSGVCPALNGQNYKSPLTLFNCFNTNSYGQIFTPTTTGNLTSFTMSMTCLNPAGTPPTGLFANLYVTSNQGVQIPAQYIARTPVSLSTCPTLTSWNSRTFVSSDFADVPINFSGVTLTAGTTYAVFFDGIVPGSPLPPPPSPTPISNTALLTLAGLLAAAGWWTVEQRRQRA